MSRFNHIMVGLTNTVEDGDLIRYASMICRLCEPSDISFVHVRSDSAATTREKALAHMKESISATFLNAGDRLKSHFEVLEGPPLDQLLGFVVESKVDLALVGHRRGQSSRRALARRLAMKAPCSIWMAPQNSPAVLRQVLVPVDFSEHAAEALCFGAGLAKMSGAACLALHVHVPDASLLHEDLRAQKHDSDRDASAQFVATTCPGEDVEAITEQGTDTSAVILRVAAERHADLIVMGTRGRSRSTAILLGGETEQILMQSRLPVLTIKRAGARLGVVQALLERSHWK